MMAGIEGENSGTPGTEQARPGPGFRRRVVVKFKDHVQLPREDTARALERQGVGDFRGGRAVGRSGTRPGPRPCNIRVRERRLVPGEAGDARAAGARPEG